MLLGRPNAWQNESAGKKSLLKFHVPEFTSNLHWCKSPCFREIQHLSLLQNKYDRICKRRGKKRAIIAIARMILTAIYNMFVTGEEWNPSDLYKIDMPQEMLEKQKEKAIKQAVKLLISNGVIKEADISAA